MRGLDDLPEPAALYQVFAAHYPLDWGEPLPTKAELAAKFGGLATRRALELLSAIDWRDAAATADLLALVPPGAGLYQLEKRIKSPESLARKIKDSTGKRQRPPVIEDVQRYTLLTTVHDRLAELTKRSANDLHEHGWRLTGVRNSYVDGSRYKGIHLNSVDPRGRRIEIQVQSTAAVAVKEATTKPYEIARNADLPRGVREEARLECIRLSNSLPNPVGLDRLTELLGIPVQRKGYGHGQVDGRRDGKKTPGVSGRPSGYQSPLRRGLEL